MTQEDMFFETLEASAMGGFDALRILEDKFILTAGGEEHTFDTPKDALGRIVSVKFNGKDMPITYGAYTVTFSGGGASGTLPEPITQDVGQAVTMPGPGDLVNSDAFFNGWKDSDAGNVYFEGNIAAFSADVEMIARWMTLVGEDEISV